MKVFRLLPSLLVALLVSTAINTPVQAAALPLQRQNSRTLSVGEVDLRRTEKGLSVFGYVTALVAPPINPGVHVHVQLVDQNGRLLAEKVTSLNATALGNFARGGFHKTYFSVLFPSVPRAARTIVVSARSGQDEFKQ